MTQLSSRAARLGHGLRLKLRSRSWRERPLPECLILGAQRAGTTSLHAYLSEHPELAPACVKEVHYFSGGMTPDVDAFAKGEAWYRAHFERRLQGGRRKSFEATPLYLFNPLAPERISAMLPQAKLIVLLRNPTQRAISQYFHERRLGCESLPMLAAFQAEQTRLAPALASGEYKGHAFVHHSYKRRGLYKQKLDAFAARFPSSQLLVLDSERIFRAPRETLREVFEFLDVAPDFEVQDLSPRNASPATEPVAPEVLEHLNDYFREANRDLYEATGIGGDWQ